VVGCRFDDGADDDSDGLPATFMAGEESLGCTCWSSRPLLSSRSGEAGASVAPPGGNGDTAPTTAEAAVAGPSLELLLDPGGCAGDVVAVSPSLPTSGRREDDIMAGGVVERFPDIASDADAPSLAPAASSSCHSLEYSLMWALATSVLCPYSTVAVQALWDDRFRCINAVMRLTPSTENLDALQINNNNNHERQNITEEETGENNIIIMSVTSSSSLGAHISPFQLLITT
jgi:hypothetical protein